MAKLRKIFRGIRRASAFSLAVILPGNAAAHIPQKPKDPTIKARHISPTPCQQLYESPSDGHLSSSEHEPLALHVMNPDPPSPPSDSLPPSPPSHQASLDELFLGDEITYETFELQISDEQEDNEREDAYLAPPPRPSSRLEMRSEEPAKILPPLDGSLFPESITFKNSPFPIFSRKNADATVHRQKDSMMPAITENLEIFPTLPLEHRLTRLSRRGAKTTLPTDNLEIIPTPPLEQRLTHIPRREADTTPQTTSLRLCRLERTLDTILAALDIQGERLPALTTATSILYYRPPRGPILHAAPLPFRASNPPGFTSGRGNGSYIGDSTARWTGYNTIHSPNEHPAPQRQSLIRRNRGLPFTYNGRSSNFEKDYFTYRHDKRKRFLEQDWEEKMKQLMMAKKLAKRLTLVLENLGEFSVDFEDCNG
ncbi:MAG: hypothetical protein M1830_010455 [Pleopsidium flavum]|nr:MAG: hypothetical protein M1830_010455 [Pleopsidium flavum]